MRRRILIAAAVSAPTIARAQTAWPDRPIRVIVFFGRDPFLRQQFYSEFEALYDLREVIGDYALLTRKPGK